MQKSLMFLRVDRELDGTALSRQKGVRNPDRRACDENVCGQCIKTCENEKTTMKK